MERPRSRRFVRHRLFQPFTGSADGLDALTDEVSVARFPIQIAASAVRVVGADCGVGKHIEWAIVHRRVATTSVCGDGRLDSLAVESKDHFGIWEPTPG